MNFEAAELNMRPKLLELRQKCRRDVPLPAARLRRPRVTRRSGHQCACWCGWRGGRGRRGLPRGIAGRRGHEGAPRARLPKRFSVLGSAAPALKTPPLVNAWWPCRGPIVALCYEECRAARGAWQEERGPEFVVFVLAGLGTLTRRAWA